VPRASSAIALALALSLGPGSCAEQPPAFPPDLAASIAVGRTTVAELEQRLGEPRSREPSPQGTKVTWREDQPVTFGRDHVRRLTVDASATGVVSAFELESNVPDDRTPPPALP
jgi:hypothetical protein